MVGSRILRALFPLALLCALLIPYAPGAAAQELGKEGEFSLREEYRMEIDEVGDARITDVITYDRGWFDEYGYLFEENPGLLSRRYRSDSGVGEVEDFEVKVDARKATVTISFRTPGLAYNLKDGWTVFGYAGYALDRESDDEVVLEAYWTLNNEWTLFETMGLEERVVIDLPAGAREARFDESSGTLTYRLPPAKAEKGFLAANKTLLILVFSLLMAVSLLLLLFLLTRRAAPFRAPASLTPHAPPAAQAGAGEPMPPAAAGTAPETGGGGMGTEAGGDIPGGQASGAAPTPLYCRRCGHPRASAQERFCRRCGTPHA
ncbi:MAG: hypothetical protein QME88_07765 [Actinomycetota bacterium]|nr:hypothetical protein [Actinomycetota bacterium]